MADSIKFDKKEKVFLLSANFTGTQLINGRCVGTSMCLKQFIFMRKKEKTKIMHKTFIMYEETRHKAHDWDTKLDPPRTCFIFEDGKQAS